MAAFIVLFGALVFVLVGSSDICGGLVGDEDGAFPAFVKGSCWVPAAFTTLSFVLGGVTSIVAGYIGMKIAVFSNARTAIQCSGGLAANLVDPKYTTEEQKWKEGFNCAFRAGSVMGFSLTGVGVLVLYLSTLVYKIYSEFQVGGLCKGVADGDKCNANSVYGHSQALFECVAGFGLGGSSIALFGRVGGGIYTKAADVGADLVGKVEKDLPEDDIRNSACIADNVGDNVGDVAGMGADLFESYVGSIIAAAAIGNNVSELRKMYPLIDTLKEGDATAETIQSWRNNAQALPFWIAGCGVFASVIGVFCTRAWPCLLRPVMEEKGGCSFMYRYISRESCSQFDSLPLTSLTIFLTRLDRRRRRHVRRHHAALEQGHGASLYEGRGWACVAHPLLGEQKDSGASGVLLHGARRGTRRERSALRRR